MKYLRLFGKMAGFNLKVQMQYRVNFLLQLPFHLSWTLKEVVVIFLMYRYTDRILTWDRYEYIFLLGTYFVADSIFSCILLPNLSNLSAQLVNGTFDHILLKPIDSQFYTMTYEMGIGVLFAMLLGFVLVIWSGVRVGLPASAGRVLAYLLFLVAGIAIYGALLFICAVPVFCLIRIDYIHNIFLCIANISRKPLEVFPDLVVKLLYVIPVAFISYVPACCYLGKLDLKVGAVSVFAAALLWRLARALWKMGVRRYVSVS